MTCTGTNFHTVDGEPFHIVYMREQNFATSLLSVFVTPYGVVFGDVSTGGAALFRNNGVDIGLTIKGPGTAGTQPYQVIIDMSQSNSLEVLQLTEINTVQKTITLETAPSAMPTGPDACFTAKTSQGISAVTGVEYAGLNQGVPYGLRMKSAINFYDSNRGHDAALNLTIGQATTQTVTTTLQARMEDYSEYRNIPWLTGMSHTGYYDPLIRSCLDLPKAGGTNDQTISSKSLNIYGELRFKRRLRSDDYESFNAIIIEPTQDGSSIRFIGFATSAYLSDPNKGLVRFRMLGQDSQASYNLDVKMDDAYSTVGNVLSIVSTSGLTTQAGFRPPTMILDAYSASEELEETGADLNTLHTTWLGLGANGPHIPVAERKDGRIVLKWMPMTNNMLRDAATNWETHARKADREYELKRQKAQS